MVKKATHPQSLRIQMEHLDFLRKRAKKNKNNTYNYVAKEIHDLIEKAYQEETKPTRLAK